MTAYGGTTALSAATTSRLQKYLGHRLLFGVAAFLNLGIYAAMLLWKPNTENGIYSFGIAATWGLAEGIWQAQSNGKIILPLHS